MCFGARVLAFNADFLLPFSVCVWNVEKHSDIQFVSCVHHKVSKVKSFILRNNPILERKSSANDFSKLLGLERLCQTPNFCRPSLLTDQLQHKLDSVMKLE
jgi:hypothetical protein